MEARDKLIFWRIQLNSTTRSNTHVFLRSSLTQFLGHHGGCRVFVLFSCFQTDASPVYLCVSMPVSFSHGACTSVSPTVSMLPTGFICILKKRRKWPHARKQAFKHLSPKMRTFSTTLLKTGLSAWISVYTLSSIFTRQDQTRRTTLGKLLECMLMKMNKSFYVNMCFFH